MQNEVAKGHTLMFRNEKGQSHEDLEKRVQTNIVYYPFPNT